MKLIFFIIRLIVFDNPQDVMHELPFEERYATLVTSLDPALHVLVSYIIFFLLSVPLQSIELHIIMKDTSSAISLQDETTTCKLHERRHQRRRRRRDAA